jgi:hypothetical protein
MRYAVAAGALMISLLLPITANADRATSTAESESEEPSPPRPRRRPGLFLRLDLGAGIGHYWQKGHADRDALGAPVEIHFGIGGSVGRRLAIGFYFQVAPWVSTVVHNEVSGDTYDPIPVSMSGHAGVLFELLPTGPDGTFALELTVGWGGANGGAYWGGMGPMITLAPTVRFLHKGPFHLGIYGRLSGAYMFWFDNPADRGVIAGTLGLSWTYF